MNHTHTPGHSAFVWGQWIPRQRNRGFPRKDAAEGVRLRASDLVWVHGHGPVVRGMAEVLALTLTGRSVVHDELSGEGVLS